jgi:hypothetical protein
MTDPAHGIDPKTAASARRRLGFVAILWWIAALAGAIGLMQGLPAGRIRYIFIGISWILALFFTYAWWEVRKGKFSQ